MISDYITKVKANISIYATQKTSSVLDGTYTSVYMGRSMNFEDLREYVPGDSIRDIDWKASSRSRNLLVKRYVAEKKHNILLLMGLNMFSCSHCFNLRFTIYELRFPWDYFLLPACPPKRRVGANSPSLWPTMFSVM